MSIVLITGTDTGVGKTVTTVLLAKELRRQGKNVAVVKPVETGCELVSGKLVPADGILLRAAVDSRQELEDIVYYRFADPVSPNLAAKNAGVEIDIEELRTKILALSEECDFVLIEGAGGLLVPILLEYSFADLAKDINASLLVVCGSKLGVLNHAALTFEVIRARGINALGYVCNEVLFDKSDISLLSNREQLRCLSDNYEIAELAYLPFIGGREDLLNQNAVFEEFVSFLSSEQSS